MSRPGTASTTPSESLFASLKKECPSRVHFATFTEGFDAVAAYIDGLGSLPCADILRLDTSARSTTRIVRVAFKRPDQSKTPSTFSGSFHAPERVETSRGVCSQMRQQTYGSALRNAGLPRTQEPHGGSAG
jgi:hypothetical protein